MQDLNKDYKLSDYNYAAFTNLDLHILWAEARRHHANGEYDKWNVDLNNIWGIIGGDINEGSETEKEFLKICLDIDSTGRLSIPQPNGFERINKDILIKRRKQYALIFKKHIWLMRLQNKTGHGSKYVDEMEDALQ